MKGSTPIGSHRHVVMLQNPAGTPIGTPDGSYTQLYADLGIWHCSIEPATQRDLERIAAGTVISEATHVLKGRWRDGITTGTRAIFNGRVFNVTGVSNLEERNVDLELVAVEVIV